MRIEINLQKDLPEVLKERIRRQVAYKLGSKSASVHAVRVSLKTLTLTDGASWYECRMMTKLKNGSSHKTQTRSRQPNICIADTASRLSRAINREAQQLVRPNGLDMAHESSR
ncbi:MAG: hypothetical protein AAF541_19625 [Pseudomonadota bacterium]